MSTAAAKLSHAYTWSDYQSWPAGERWELVGGEAVAMSPSPSSRHQDLVGELTALMRTHFRGKTCRVFPSPMDVKLSDEDVVQPDLLVVCRPEQIRRTHIEGPPSLVVEVLSDSSLRHDRHTKRMLYARFGIPEYWIVTPFPHLVEILVLENGRYVLDRSFTRTDELTSATIPDLRFPLDSVFDFPLDEEEKKLLVVKEPPVAYRAAR